MQYLEDCGILAKVLAGDLCSHYRPFNGFIFYSWCRPLDKLDSKAEMCSSCHLKKEVKDWDRLVLVGNFLSGKCARTHDLCIFFESNQIPYTAYDPCNGHLDPSCQNFFAKHKIEQAPVRLPRIWIFNTEVKIKTILELASKGLLLSILRKQRCQFCLKKTQQCQCEPPKEESSPTTKLQIS